MKKKSLFILLIFMALGIILIFSFSFFVKSRLSCENDASDAFKISVKKENEERWKQFEIPVHFIYKEEMDDSPNQIKIQAESGTMIHERNDSIRLNYDDFFEKSQHTYLALKYPPNVLLLDSIFIDELKKRGISAQTAVIYTYKDSVSQKSREDSGFFASQLYKTEVVSGVMDEIRIQGFVRLTPGVIIRQKPVEWVIIAFGGIVIVLSCIFGMIRLNKAKPLFPEKATQFETVQWHGKILLNCNRHVLIYDGKEILLTQQICKILELFGKAHNHYLEYEQLINSLYGKVIYSDGINRLNQLIKRLRTDIMKKTPNLEILNVKKKGYQLEIKEGYNLIVEE